MINLKASEKQEAFIKSVLSEDIDFTLYGGAIRGGKTIVSLFLLSLLHKRVQGLKTHFIRKDRPRLRQNSVPVFQEKVRTNQFSGENMSLLQFYHQNGGTLTFYPENYERDKELLRWAGMETNVIVIDELNELTEKAFYKAFERAGSYIIPGRKQQPKPRVFATCNPTWGWVREKIYEPWKKGTLPSNWNYIPANIYDNPAYTQEYIEQLKRNLPYYEFEFYVNGNWDIQLKTGGEFFKNFEPSKHVRPLDYVDGETVHISIDDNVHPYIAISFWQIIKGTKIRQIYEIPAKDPYNTATSAGNLARNYLKKIGYKDIVFVYGDQTTKKSNTIDDEKRSFLDKFCEALGTAFHVRKRFPQGNPPVALSGEFINAIYQGYDNLEIEINEFCKESINDYTQVKEDADGKMLKKAETDPNTGIRYEPLGHFSDTKRYFICEAFKESFRKFRRGSENYDFRVGGRHRQRM